MVSDGSNLMMLQAYGSKLVLSKPFWRLFVLIFDFPVYLLEYIYFIFLHWNLGVGVSKKPRLTLGIKFALGHFGHKNAIKLKVISFGFLVIPLMFGMHEHMNMMSMHMH